MVSAGAKSPRLEALPSDPPFQVLILRMLRGKGMMKSEDERLVALTLHGEIVICLPLCASDLLYCRPPAQMQ